VLGRHAVSLEATSEQIDRCSHAAPGAESLHLTSRGSIAGVTGRLYRSNYVKPRRVCEHNRLSTPIHTPLSSFPTLALPNPYDASTDCARRGGARLGPRSQSQSPHQHDRCSASPQDPRIQSPRQRACTKGVLQAPELPHRPQLAAGDGIAIGTRGKLVIGMDVPRRGAGGTRHRGTHRAHVWRLRREGAETCSMQRALPAQVGSGARAPTLRRCSVLKHTQTPTPARTASARCVQAAPSPPHVCRVTGRAHTPSDEPRASVRGLSATPHYSAYTHRHLARPPTHCPPLSS
jgi:hypothetical protein